MSKRRNAETSFAELRKELQLGDQARVLPLDDAFDLAFEHCFDVVLGAVDRAALFSELDRTHKGELALLEWKLFHWRWRKSCKSMADFVSSLARRDESSNNASNNASSSSSESLEETLEDDDECEFLERAFEHENDECEFLERALEHDDDECGFLERAFEHCTPQRVPSMALDETFPIEFGLRVMTNSTGGIQSLEENARRLIKGIDACRTAKLSTIVDDLVAVVATYARTRGSFDEEKESVCWSELREECGRVRRLAIDLSTGGPADQKVLAAKIAMTSTAVECGLGASPASAHAEFNKCVSRLLADDRVAKAFATQLRGRQFSLEKRSARETVIRGVLLLAAREHAFALSHGLRAADAEPLVPFADLHQLLEPTASGYVRSLRQRPLELEPDEIACLGRYGRFARYKRLLETRGVVDATKKAEILHGLRTDKLCFLHGANIGAEGAAMVAAALEHNATLERIVLQQSDVGPEGVAFLVAALDKTSNNLTGLWLPGNNIGDQGANLIAQALAKDVKITDLHIGNNNITDWGALRIAEALNHNSTLELLRISDNHLTDDARARLQYAAAQRPSLTIISL
ncbi:hypothetical protein CTAYLR_003619 [Chrysophaeum taylorii]|uniref:Uncharacterized protein n=1 Tax=Chrysophaeum taylorii TaxID=2483200 RepID=A0AAD7UEC6_9STRA|nr:hypothetical protein CTAYLR_003619 [Chrysophaeum taylorii]